MTVAMSTIKVRTTAAVNNRNVLEIRKVLAVHVFKVSRSMDGLMVMEFFYFSLAHNFQRRGQGERPLAFIIVLMS